jgi:hypothetical protein
MLAIHAENMAWGMFNKYASAGVSPSKFVFDGILQCTEATDANLLNYRQSSAAKDLYGGLAASAVAGNVWNPNVTDGSSAVNISFNLLRDTRISAKINNVGGKKKKPTMCVMPEDQFAILRDIAGTLIRLDTDSEAAKFGFSTVIHEGMKIDPDDFCPDDSFVMINEHYWGLRLLKGGNHDRTKWTPLENSAGDTKMDMYANGNWVTPCRAAHAYYYGLASA